MTNYPESWNRSGEKEATFHNTCFTTSLIAGFHGDLPINILISSDNLWSKFSKKSQDTKRKTNGAALSRKRQPANRKAISEYKGISQRNGGFPKQEATIFTLNPTA